MSSFFQGTASGDPQHAMLLYLSLISATFIHEGAAIALGAMLLVQHQASPVLTAACLVGGIIAGDLGVYGLGVLGRQNDWVQRRFGAKTQQKTSVWFVNHLIASIAMCRVVPGLLYPTFFSFGWCGVPFRRFAPVTIVVSAIYVTTLLTVLVQFGKKLSLPPQSGVSLVVGAILLGALMVVGRILWTRYRTGPPHEAR